MPSFKITHGNRSVRIDLTNDGFDLSAEGEHSGRFLEVDFAEGGLTLKKPGSITTDTGLELDENGRAVFHDA